jgi:hypothetical protein
MLNTRAMLATVRDRQNKHAWNYRGEELIRD